LKKINITINGEKKVEVEAGTKLSDIFKLYEANRKRPIILAKFNGKCHELRDKIDADGEVKTVDISSRVGHKAYLRTLQFIFVKAVYDLFPEAMITLEHSLSKGIFGELHKQAPLKPEEIMAIKKRMQEIISADLEIKKYTFTKAEAIKIFTDYKMMDKVGLLKHVGFDKVSLYELDGRYDYFYGNMAYSTGVINLFDLSYYEPGFLLRFPSEENVDKIPEFIEQKKLATIFYETEQWGNILDVGDVGALNEKVENDEIIDIIRVAEALQEKKIAYIADMIKERTDVKLVLIAGPSSSGKTTFSKRLGIQLRVNGYIPVPISLDDYFVERDKTPKDENGDYDFESPYALDLELFNNHLNSLMTGNEIEIPVFDFKTGTRQWKGHKLALPSNGIIVVEGIHGLNDVLTSEVPSKNKFKVYISALTQLNIDNHNRIATTNARIIRRIVRDYLTRGYRGETTLNMWPSIRRGEEKNIFVFQESADVMFNSSLVYELCVLKKYALEELSKIPPESSVYEEACNLKSFLRLFKEIDIGLVPENSILREFIGGSCFYKY
jgi:uridine kinase